MALGLLLLHTAGYLDLVVARPRGRRTDSHDQPGRAGRTEEQTLALRTTLRELKLNELRKRALGGGPSCVIFYISKYRAKLRPLCGAWLVVGLVGLRRGRGCSARGGGGESRRRVRRRGPERGTAPAGDWS